MTATTIHSNRDNRDHANRGDLEARVRDRTAVLPQIAADVFVTDGGLETSLIFDEGIDLPDFAAFVLLRDAAGREALRPGERRVGDASRHRARRARRTEPCRGRAAHRRLRGPFHGEHADRGERLHRATRGRIPPPRS
jgi:hypothetical protein